MSMKMLSWMLISAMLFTSSWGDCLGENGLAIISSEWLRDDCAASDWCYGADLNLDGDVNLTDFAASAAAEPIVLVENGVCRVSIHNIAVGTPSLVEQYAATQLQAAIAHATGVTPAINPTTPAAVKIKLGLATRFNVGIGSTASQAYCYRRAADGNIELVGKTGPAILWAVDGFAREVLHVTWPIADGMISRVGPVQSTLTIEQLCKTDEPDFTRRGWVIGDNTDGYHYNDLICDWMSRSRQNVIYNPVSQLSSVRDKKRSRGIEPDTSMHSFWWLINANEYYDTHPEYFPLINGVRVKPDDPSCSLYLQLCLSNPDVLNITIQKAVTAFYQYPEMTIFGVCPNDGSGGWCECDNCRAMDGDQLGTGRYTNRLIAFCNQVGNALAPYYPSKFIGTDAYSDSAYPPTIDVASNVAITFCTGGRNYMKPLTDPTDSRNAPIMSRLNGWLAKTSNVRFWEYYYFTGENRCPCPWARTLCNEFADLYNLGLDGMCSETHPNKWIGMSFFTYTFSRLSWDTSLTYDTLIADFCAERYGPAAATMEAFHRLYEDTIYEKVPKMVINAPGEQLLPNAFTAEQIATLDSYLTTAEAAAAASGTNYNKTQVANERALFTEFQRLLVDPETIAGIGANMVSNPGGELGTTDWSGDIRRGTYTFDAPTGGAHSGLRSLRIHCTGTPGQARWYRPINGFTVGKKYAARIWMKATAGVNGEIWIFCSGQTTIGFTDSQSQWVMLVCPEFTATSTGASFYMNNFGTGDVYFDDIFFAELPD